jgi:monoamine oxidase
VCWRMSRKPLEIFVHLVLSFYAESVIKSLESPWFLAAPTFFSMSLSSKDVLIIGAGAAGLAAARDLSKEGLNVIVVEARSRTGGRIYTHHDEGESMPIELGAEFMHGKSPELFSIIKSAHLKFEKVTSRHWFLEDGELVKSRNFWSAVEQLTEQMKHEIKDRSFKSFLDSLPNDETSMRTKEIASRYVEGFHAAAIDRIGIHGLTAINEAEESIDSEVSFRLLDGYVSIINWLREEAERNGTQFRLATTVSEVSWQPRKIEAKCLSNGEQFLSANCGLITIPLPLLKLGGSEYGAIRFVPDLPVSKQKAIRSLEMGPVLRIVLRFTHQFWKGRRIPGNEEAHFGASGFMHYPDASIPTWWTTLPEHAPMLVGWAGGPPAEKALTGGEEQINSRAIQSLSQIFRMPESELHSYLVKSYFHDWQSDSLSQGAYAYVPVDGLEHQLNLAKPIDDTLFFAGEATSVGHIGTVHGAIQSGQRAAREILAASGRNER